MIDTRTPLWTFLSTNFEVAVARHFGNFVPNTLAPPLNFTPKETRCQAKFMTSAKFMTLTLSLTLIYDPNPNPNPIPCEILDVEILDACADSPIVINFASGEFRATPGLTPNFSKSRTSQNWFQCMIAYIIFLLLFGQLFIHIRPWIAAQQSIF